LDYLGTMYKTRLVKKKGITVYCFSFLLGEFYVG
jgi:hypothetical protein